MINWRRGQVIVTRNRTAKEGSSTSSSMAFPPGTSAHAACPGVAVYLNPSKETTPLALRMRGRALQTFPKRALMVSIDMVSIPHVDEYDRFAVEEIGRRVQDVPCDDPVRAITTRSTSRRRCRLCRKQGLLEKNLDLEHASYFVSRIAIKPTDGPPTAALAQESVRRDGPQRREPHRSLRAPQRQDGDRRRADSGIAAFSVRAVPRSRQAPECGDHGHDAGDRPAEGGVRPVERDNQGDRERDLEVLEFIARFGVVPRFAVSVWAKTGRSVTLDRERRLREARLVVSHPPLDQTGPLLLATRTGLRLCGRTELRPARLSLSTVATGS